MAQTIKRLHYFNHQFLRAEDFTDEQEYHLGMRRHHNRLLHTYGIAEGLEVPDPPSGSTAVTVTEGIALDNLGREIVLTEDFSLQLESFAANKAVYVTIEYDEAQSDPTDETGVVGDRRWTEDPKISATETKPTDPGARLILGLVNRSGKEVASIDRSDRRVAGVAAGDLEVRSLTLTDPNVVSAQWASMRLGQPNQADIQGDLQISGNLVVAGTIQGDLASTIVETADLAPNVVTSPKIAEADGTTGQNANSGRGVKTGHIQDGAVTDAKLAANAVTGAKIANNTINENKFDAATQGKLVSNGNSHAHSGGDGAQIKHSALSHDDGRNPHKLTAADIQALTTSGGVVSGRLELRGSSSFLVADRAKFNGRVSFDDIATFDDQVIFNGGKNGYVVDRFVNASGKKLQTGDVVALKGTPIRHFIGVNNKIPVVEVTLVDKEDDRRIIGIVDREAVPEQGAPDKRVGPEDPTFIEDGGDLLAVTLGAYAHCKVDATEASIEPGDLLTSSSKPGCAKKAADPKIGSIIGKALEALKEGTGYIAVFVNIQ